MSETSGISKIVGSLGHMLALAGFAAFFFGIFGPIRNVLFVGIALIVLALAAYFVEEIGARNSAL